MTFLNCLYQNFEFKISFHMQQISSNICVNSNQGPNKNGKMKFFDTLTECFSEYFANMFKDFGDILVKRLQIQEKKIKQNERLLMQLSRKLESQSMLSLTSLVEIQLNENESQTPRVKSLSIQSKKDSIQLVQVNKALKKLEQGINYLEASLTFMKSKKSIEDPENINSIEGPQLKGIQQEIKRFENTTTATSKIEKFTNKINRFAKESSIEQIENGSGFDRPRKFEKSRSLITLSNRRYYPVSCPKRYEYGLFRVKDNTHSESQIVAPFCEEYTNEQTQFSTINQNSSLLLQLNSRISESNKMPLINKSKSVLNQLLSLVNDTSDANVVIFYLKKGLRSLEEIGRKEKKSKKHQQNDLKGWGKKGNDNSQYSMERGNTLKVHNTFESGKVLTSACSIIEMLPNSESQLSWMKENNTFKNSENELTRGMPQNMSQNSQSNADSTLSRQKRKYFQRTSSDQKMALLKNKFRPNN